MGQTVNLVAYAFAGSNPAAPTFLWLSSALLGAVRLCGRSSMVELQPSKLVVWVRFPSPALLRADSSAAAVAQSVECVLGKDEVMGSSPISSFV